ncbi:hypothetical protein D3C81_1025940 [compost metagenome]
MFFHLRKAVLEAEQIQAAIGAFARRIVAVDALRHFNELGVAARLRRQHPCHRDALGLAAGEHGTHGHAIDTVVHALAPQVRHQFVKLAARRHLAIRVRRQRFKVKLGAVATDLDLLIQRAARGREWRHAHGDAQQGVALGRGTGDRSVKQGQQEQTVIEAGQQLARLE